MNSMSLSATGVVAFGVARTVAIKSGADAATTFQINHSNCGKTVAPAFQAGHIGAIAAHFHASSCKGML